MVLLPRRVLLGAAAAAVTGPLWRAPAGHAAAPPLRVSQLGQTSGAYMPHGIHAVTHLSDMSVLVASASADSAYIPTELQIVGEAELRLEEQLQEMIDGWGAPGARLSPAQIDAAEGVARQLERLRGRQQRAGWGQSDSPYDLPMIGAWDVLYSSEPADYAPEPGGPRLVSARQWVYGPCPV